jgi:hypothetical protein
MPCAFKEQEYFLGKANAVRRTIRHLDFARGLLYIPVTLLPSAHSRRAAFLHGAWIASAILLVHL